MRATVSPAVKVKAAGGVRTLDALIDCINAGIDRCGATATAADASTTSPPARGRPRPDGGRYLGLDLGGTNIKVAVIEARPTVARRSSAATAAATEAGAGPPW